jgi:hypothetical protein
VIAMAGLSIGLKLSTAPLAVLGEDLGWFGPDYPNGLPFVMGHHRMHINGIESLFMVALGVVVLTALMHLARGIVRGHARLAKALLVEPGS